MLWRVLAIAAALEAAALILARLAQSAPPLP